MSPSVCPPSPNPSGHHTTDLAVPFFFQSDDRTVTEQNVHHATPSINLHPLVQYAAKLRATTDQFEKCEKAASSRCNAACSTFSPLRLVLTINILLPSPKEGAPPLPYGFLFHLGTLTSAKSLTISSAAQP